MQYGEKCVARGTAGSQHLQRSFEKERVSLKYDLHQIKQVHKPIAESTPVNVF